VIIYRIKLVLVKKFLYLFKNLKNFYNNVLKMLCIFKMTDYNDKQVDILQKYFPSDYKGTMIEIGAFEPVLLSISYPFEQKGWDTYQIEANTEGIQAFDIRKNKCLNYAISNEDKDDVEFTIVTSLDVNWTASFSSLNPSIEGFHRHPSKKIKVKTRTMNTLFQNELKHLSNTQIDLVVIDVEGSEYDVVQGFDLNKIRPKLFCIEDLTRNTFENKDFYNQVSLLHKHMVKNGYILDQFTGQDSIYKDSRKN